MRLTQASSNAGRRTCVVSKNHYFAPAKAGGNRIKIPALLKA